MDPDRWEFANEWFLRDQKHLLKNIVRRKQSKNQLIQRKSEDLDDEEMFMEISRLKEEQQNLDREIDEMNRRPQQMISFLHKVVKDPDLIPRKVVEKERIKRICSEEKGRLRISSPSSSASSGLALSNYGCETVSGSQLATVAGMRSSLVVSLAANFAAGYGERKVGMGYFGEMAAVAEARTSPPYPFSLFG